MKKQTIDYRQGAAETLKALAEGRVLLASRGRQGRANAMAIGWGTIGIIWGRPIFVVLVRPSRYTYTLIEETGQFTVNVLPATMTDVASYCGTHSGRDHDKIREEGLTEVPGERVALPTLAEAEITFECTVVHKNDVLPSELARAVREGCYSGGDFHRLYFGEIMLCQRNA